MTLTLTLTLIVGELMLWWYKHLAGGGGFILMCALIWGPLFIFSGSSPFLSENPTRAVTLHAQLVTPWTTVDVWDVTTSQISSYAGSTLERCVNQVRPDLMRKNVLQSRQVRVGETLQTVRFIEPSTSTLDLPAEVVSATAEFTNGQVHHLTPYTLHPDPQSGTDRSMVNIWTYLDIS